MYETRSLGGRRPFFSSASFSGDFSKKNPNFFPGWLQPTLWHIWRLVLCHPRVHQKCSLAVSDWLFRFEMVPIRPRFCASSVEAITTMIVAAAMPNKDWNPRTRTGPKDENKNFKLALKDKDQHHRMTAEKLIYFFCPGYWVYNFLIFLSFLAPTVARRPSILLWRNGSQRRQKLLERKHQKVLSFVLKHRLLTP